jgi:3-hydroxyacyl-CoA dehydrogenase
MSIDPGAIRTIAVIGTGTIGASWAALFLGHGLDVIASDPAAGAEARLRAFLVRVLPDARPEPAPAEGNLTFVATPEQAAAGADLVQENAPEREDLKSDLIARLEAAAPPHALIASSTTAFPQSTVAAKAKNPARIIVAHPFNPPHLVPLVELVGVAPEAPAVQRAFAFYKSLGREPVILRKEAVGHLANRLQAAVMREALYCLEQGIADVEDIDRAVRYGPGLRWAVMGPFQTYHLAGGAGGIRHYFAHLGRSQARRWSSLGTPMLNEELEGRVVAGVERMVGDKSIAKLEAERDHALTGVLKAVRCGPTCKCFGPRTATSPASGTRDP